MRGRVIDPNLLPHARPCWCSECKRAYQRLYAEHEKQSGVVRFYGSTCADCGAPCSRQAQRCRKCSGIARRSTPVVKTCKCGNEIPNNGRSDQCRDCYLASVTKITWHKQTCEWCGKTWQSRLADAQFCSGACSRASQGLPPIVKKPPRVRGTCSTCGAKCENFVCASCQYEVRRLHRRIDKNRRRGAQGYTKYDKREIAIRDGWLCYLCGGSVAPHLWGLIDPDAPTIDHVIPVSRGGSDTDDNVKLAHRVCNMRKSNKVGNGVGTRTKRESGSVDTQAA